MERFMLKLCHHFHIEPASMFIPEVCYDVPALGERHNVSIVTF